MKLPPVEKAGGGNQGMLYRDVIELPVESVYERISRDGSFSQLLGLAIAEDLGDRGDVTSDLFISPEAQIRCVIRNREPGSIAGLGLLHSIAAAYSGEIEVSDLVEDGIELEAGSDIGVISGPTQAVLRAERVMLNFLGYLSGIATLTRTYVKAIEGSNAQIVDTRKTAPGWRYLAKAAVRCGGGHCHRMGLYDAMLIKDNHLWEMDEASTVEALSRSRKRADELQPPLTFIEIEVDTLEQLSWVLNGDTNVDMVLLDNMPADALASAVGMRDELAPQTRLEASGGVTLDTVVEIAESGVDRIAIGALTHSVRNLDIGLDA